MLRVVRSLRLKLPSSRKYASFTTNKTNTFLPSCSASFVTQKLVVTQSVLQHNLQIVRYKSKSKSKQGVSSESESEDNDEEETELTDKHTKVLKINVTSLRLDGIIRNALGIARNKVEEFFYQSKIRVNGEKVPKKSVSVKEGDEIDIIKGAHQNNPDLLVVARIEILSAVAKEDSITLKIRRCKSLIIENYLEDKWSGS